MIKEYEFYHGTVFTKLIHAYPNNLTIGTYPTKSNASYILGEGIGIYIKHSTKRLNPWRFSFAKEHQEEIDQMKIQLKEVFVVLVCGKDGIVVLSYDELKNILDEQIEEMEWISASRTRRKEYTVAGSDGKLTYKISKSDFPQKVLKHLLEAV